MAKIFCFAGMDAINFIDLSEEEIFQVLAFRNHPEISRWMYDASPISLQRHLQFLENLKHSASSCYWLFKKEGQALGVGSITRRNFSHKSAHFGLYKNPNERRAGDGILQFLEHIAFDHLGLHSVVLEVMEENQRAIACYERNGFVRTGTLQEYVFVNQQYQDVFIYGKINPQHSPSCSRD
ncbi:UDP-4-amino-4,6-dideoxy-N-acetyl-beta-L-altrosamine N-acetyltransferase [Helicobacter mustelae]|uniref:Putative flagellar modification protein FlaG/FlmH n=1 Tax=Helicobacter mustelae (strain ATCC 43772 / CCUG 25715 / CIP 103759 / LMG 18044 / NCTC 12198 / R85-136P) TaxID=679897 RepID=D3UIV1_HELM1|nr:UDP-4-amino-4,6-dideoxy-N-acetyl-beta-L-altrosamine N-acetyltransferase [Helicobacter mustelae]CBG40426.1 putative flagellar modification protein FlaG/FlmH [Helicobacter mustelae 12198]SQH71926.1 flagellar modification protein FlaG/FlmH [Helicobacter mustelae]